MKKLLLMIVVSLAIVASAVCEGYVGPTAGETIATVAEALKLPDDARVVLRGYIENSLGDEEYTFRDDTGTIRVEIDRRLWRGLVVGAEDQVEIRGEVDSGWGRPNEVDAERLTKL